MKTETAMKRAKAMISVEDDGIPIDSNSVIHGLLGGTV